MTNGKSMKKALISSSISLLLCFTMLIGTTFAWFTDSVSSTNNIIKAGNLDIEVEYTLDGTTWNDLKGASNLFQKSLWEPGHTEVVALKITNAGSLALKYNANMNLVSEKVGKTKDNKDIVLSDILTVSTLAQPTDAAGDAALVQAFTGENDIAYEPSNKFKAANVLAADKELLPGLSHYLFIKVDMAETVGNEANHNGTNIPEITFGVNIAATQLNSEADSFGPDYDIDSEYPVVSTSYDLKNALTSGADTIRVSAGTYDFPASSLSAGDVLICDEDTVFEGTASLGIGGATVVGATFDAGDSNTVATGTMNGTFKDCTFTGGSEGARWCYSKAGETAVFENCVFETDFRGVHFDTLDGDVYFKKCVVNGFNAFGGSGTVHFEGCTFGNDKSYYNGLNLYMNTELIDCTFNFISGKSNFIDMEGTGKTLTITNCTATLDGATADITNFVGGSKLSQNTVIYN